MQAPPRWSDLARDIARQFGFERPRSPTLERAIEAGVHFVAVDEERRQIIFDSKALVIGLLLAGQTERDSIEWGNTASWFYEWFSGKDSAPGAINAVIDREKTDPDLIFPAYANGYAVALSEQLKDLVPVAEATAQSLSNKQGFEARHLFVAMLQSGILSEQLEQLFGFYLGSWEDDLKRNLIARMLTQPDTGETLEGWLVAFSLPSEAKTWFGTAVGGTGRDPINEVDRRLLDEFLRRQQIGAVSDLVRDILLAAARRNQPDSSSAEISSTRLFLACLAVARARGPESQAIDLLAALLALSGDNRFRVILQIDESYPKVSAPERDVIDATRNVVDILHKALSIDMADGSGSEMSADKLLCALLLQPKTAIARRLSPDEPSLEQLRTALVATLRPQTVAWERWANALRVASTAVDVFPDPPDMRRPEQVSYADVRNDNPERASLDDRLGSSEEARAFARIAAARDVDPPLAFGIFGEWGSGKSFFMRLMYDHVEKIAKKAAPEAESGSAFYQHIVQIRFNAWHYAESNLWASLVDNIFTELDRWCQNPATTVSDNTLLNKLVTARELSLEAAEHLVGQKRQQKIAAERLISAQQELALQEQNVGITPRLFWEAVKVEFDKVVTPEQLKAAADQFGMSDLADDVDELKSTLDEVRSDTKRARLVSRGLWRRLTSGWSIAALFAVIVLLPTVLMRAYEYFTADLTTLQLVINRWVVFLAGLVGGATGFVKLLQSQVRKGLDTLEGYRVKLKETIDTQLAKSTAGVQAAQKTVQDLIAEVAEAKAALVSASEQVALATRAYENDSGRERLLRFVRDRAGADGYSQHLGLIANIRKDFTQLTVLMDKADERLKGDIKKQDDDYERRVTALVKLGDGVLTPDELTGIAQLAPSSKQIETKSFDRIILYIDDLDRCPPEQVVKVLQAVHLLLSFPLFVVVVAVDSRWVSKSLEAHYATLLVEGGDFGGASANDYLEKIFQIPYWVRPMTKETSAALLSALSARRFATPQLRVERTDPTKPSSENGGDSIPPGGANDGTSVNPGGSLSPPTARVSPTTPPIFQPLQPVPGGADGPRLPEARTLVLTDRERSFLIEIAPFVGNTPRRSLRFLNIYRVIKASLDAGNLRRLEDGGYRSLMTELALVVGAPRQEGAKLIEELAGGIDIDTILGRSDKEDISAMARGALTIYKTAAKVDQNDDFRYYSDIARRFSFESQRRSHAPASQSPSTPISQRR